MHILTLTSRLIVLTITAACWFAALLLLAGVSFGVVAAWAGMLWFAKG